MENLRVGPGIARTWSERDRTQRWGGRVTRRGPRLWSQRPIVTLLTDFGQADPFVGIMKGVILSRCPEAAIVDLCHEVPPSRSSPEHSCCTPPPPFSLRNDSCCSGGSGRGSDRRALAARIGGQVFLAPDNGLLSYALDAGPWNRCGPSPSGRSACRGERHLSRARCVCLGCRTSAGGLSLDQVDRISPSPPVADSPIPPGGGGGGDRGSRLDRPIRQLHQQHPTARPRAAPDRRERRTAGVRPEPPGRLDRRILRRGGARRARRGDREHGHLELFMAQGNLAAAWGIALGDSVEVVGASRLPAAPTRG